jgi:argininosuccinate synthase
MSDIKKIVLAYSGGLDTSIIIPWLKENYPGCEIVAVAGDVGQGIEELDGLEEKALKTGASKLYVADLTDEFAEDYIIPTMKAGAIYEGYLLGTSFARPIIAKKLVEIALKENADAIAHGCTGKGNDQVRFELAVKHFAPNMKIIAPWREWDICSRDQEIDYAEAHNIPLKINRETNYSKDKNLWHLSHEGLDLEDPANEPTYEKPGFLEMSVSPMDAPDAPTYISIDFEQGVPVKLDGKKMSAKEIILALNAVGGANGIGLLDIVENRLVGIKSRGIYETPGGTILYKAHEAGTGHHLCRARLQRIVVQPAARGACGICRQDAGERDRHGQAQALQRQHHQGRNRKPVQPVFRSHRHVWRERLQPEGCGRVHQPLRSADAGSGHDERKEVTKRQRSLLPSLGGDCNRNR